LLAFTTITDSYIPKIVAIKFFPIIADCVTLIFVYKIVRIKYPRGLKPLWAASVFFILPTIFVNSAYWGQIESLYTVFLVITMYFFLVNKPFWAMIAFSFAFSIKLQAIFYAPFLAILLFKKKVNPLHFLLVPAVYLFLSLPVLILGRNI